jgi:hypothetical protein
MGTRDELLKRAISSINTQDNNPFILVSKNNNKTAGENRNSCLKKIPIDCDWIVFLDDDDYLDWGYLEEIKKAHETNLDILILRMKQEDTIIPRYENPKLEVGNVGINFCLRNSLYRKYPNTFDNKFAEDFRFLNFYLQKTKKVAITEKVFYIAPVANHKNKK